MSDEANRLLREILEFIDDQIDVEKQIRAGTKDPYCYGAGFSDGAIEALKEVRHETARRMDEPE